MLDTLRTRDDNVLETDGRRWDMVVLGDAIDRSRGNVALAMPCGCLERESESAAMKENIQCRQGTYMRE